MPSTAAVGAGVLPRQRETMRNTSLAGGILPTTAKDFAPRHPRDGPPAPGTCPQTVHVGCHRADETRDPADATWVRHPAGLGPIAPNIVPD